MQSDPSFAGARLALGLGLEADKVSSKLALRFHTRVHVIHTCVHVIHTCVHAIHAAFVQVNNIRLDLC